MPEKKRNVLDNYLRSKEPISANKICKEARISPSKISIARNSTKYSVEKALDIASALGETEITLDGYEEQIKGDKKFLFAKIELRD